MGILKSKDEHARDARLFDLARGLRYLPIIAVAVAFIAVLQESISISGAYPPLYSILVMVLVVCLLCAVSFACVRRRRPVMYPSIPHKIELTEELTLEDSVLNALQAWGAKEVSREVVLEGARVSHEPDFIFQMNGMTYIADVKTRRLVPSDVDNASLMLEDLKSSTPKICGVLLVTPTVPSPEVLRMAKSRDVEILVLPPETELLLEPRQGLQNKRTIP